MSAWRKFQTSSELYLPFFKCKIVPPTAVTAGSEATPDTAKRAPIPGSDKDCNVLSANCCYQVMKVVEELVPKHQLTDLQAKAHNLCLATIGNKGKSV